MSQPFERLDEKTRTVWRLYNSLAQLRDHSASLHDIEGGHRIERWIGDSWVGRDFKDVDELMNGVNVLHKPTMDRFEACKDLLGKLDFPRPESIRRRPRYDDSVGSLCIPHYIQGDYDRLYTNIKKVKRVGGSKTVVVASPVNVSGGNKADDVQWRAAAGAALVSLLHEAGYGVEYWIYFNGHRFNRRSGIQKPWNMEWACQIKSLDAPPNWITIANAASCWMFRTMYFSLYAHKDPRIGGAGEGLGCPQYRWNDLQFVKDKIAQGRPVISVELGGRNSGCPHRFTEQGAVDAVTEAMTDYVNNETK